MKVYGLNMDKEILRASKFFIGQIRKGWTCEEAANQTIGSYGYAIYHSVICSLNRIKFKGGLK